MRLVQLVLPRWVLLGIFDGGVPPTSPNPDPISDQKMPFPTPVFRLGLKNTYPFSDLTMYVIKHGICISAEWNST